MELTETEHTLKLNGLKLMKKYGKTLYRHNGVELTVVVGDDDLKVRVKKPGDVDDEPGGLDTDDAPAPDVDGMTFGVDTAVTQTEERRRAVDNDSGE